MWTEIEDGSVVDDEGRIIHFSLERFITDIATGNCCFICGARPDDKPFNDEHVFPEWLQRRYGLFHKQFTLPNGVGIRYDRYTVPCCVECNDLMGRVVETPMSNVVRGGADQIREFIVGGDALKVFVWMGLIFLKVHLKDRAHRVHLNRQLGDARIGDDYSWEDLHHIHSVVRCFYTGVGIDETAVGSMLIMPVNPEQDDEPFDFVDLSFAQATMLRLGDVAIYAVMNDSGGATNLFYPTLERITGPLSELQAREIVVELALMNLYMRDRPTFSFLCHTEHERGQLVGVRPRLWLDRREMAIRGQLLERAFGAILPPLNGYTEDEARAQMADGRLSFLFGNDGQFIERNRLDPPPD
ncbi:hypothetical protein [Asticcacaulis benevestitus]|uniref:Uncharacterized protein n=1 Tax=Asticcacaulis benevestitus DSM 16100 = ATCC BAA-896 TaxID=1121022 RepID=V4RMM6_9CAUL|nr:hypothetical protein [Asticcacaulis benevestitus]ESQ92528.1 hypothetical protein ABENE_07785 [Asticcacaulis benevestitus DSM 16100 = ATCC BAA-896]